MGRLQRYLLMNGLLGVICLARPPCSTRQLTADVALPVAVARTSTPAATEEEEGSVPSPPCRSCPGGGSCRFPRQSPSDRCSAPSRRPPEVPRFAPSRSPKPRPRRLSCCAAWFIRRFRRALLETAESAPLLRLREGETLDGWEIVTILPRKLVMRQGEQSLEVPISPPQPAIP